MNGRDTLFAAMALGAALFFGASPAQSDQAGMSDRNICQTAGYLVRQVRGKAFKTIDVPCEVTHQGAGAVEIRSGYKTPPAMGSRLLTYTAKGQVNDSRLRLDTIQVHGIDDAPIDFADF